MPIIKLSFEHPLNTSVQVGDIAYFANATAAPVAHPTLPGVNLTHDHSQVSEPPHETASQADIKKIGKIREIVPFTGNLAANIMGKSHIICEMDQTLFNKYANDIVAGGCSYTPVLTNATGQMMQMVRIADTPPIDPGNYHNCAVLPSAYGNCGNSLDPYVNPQTDYVNPLATLFSDNPSWYPYETAIRLVKNTNATYPTENDFALAGFPVADPNDPYYQPGRINTFVRCSYFITTDDGVTYGYPTSFSWNQLTAYHPNAIEQAPGPWVQLTGSIGPGSVNCVTGSFIMFSKDNKVNQPDMLGYYALVEYRNNDFENYSELFNTGVTYFNSSK